MAEIKNTFVKSKMNKDLDARLITNGEYRDAVNIAVSKSEGEDVGAVENVLGNIEKVDFKALVTSAVTAYYTNLGYSLNTGAVDFKNLEVIGQIENLDTNNIVVFLTDWVDTSSDKLSDFPEGESSVVGENPGELDLNFYGSGCFICNYNVLTGEATVLVAGSFLNFSKTHPMVGLDYLEDFLFFTDNRNQPRKINVPTALNRPFTHASPYYFNEDHVSVAKYAPYSPIEFVNSLGESTLINKSSQFLPASVATTLAVTTTATNTFFGLNGDFLPNPAPSTPYIAAGDQISLPGSGEDYVIQSVALNQSTTNQTDIQIVGTRNGKVFTPGSQVIINKANPDYSSTFVGDPDLLKEEFTRYSYRFKYDDGEYSLLAPFTQIAFVPEQFGYFLLNDEDKTGESGIVEFVENRVNQIKFQIKMPISNINIANMFKISELQIVVKNSKENSIKVVDDILVSDLSYSGLNYEYIYDSTKAYKTLPEKIVTRVHDKVPIRAGAQAVISNRIVYGNFTDKHGSPVNLNYNSKVEEKTSLATGTLRTEYPNHTLKQNRNYQLGLVLVDRYGRSSNVISANNLASINAALNNRKSTVYAGYTNGGVDPLNWPGNCLSFILNEKIPDSSSSIGYPGLYSTNNPLGYYTYKIVVKQQQQEYYNVYTPGAVAGNIRFDKKDAITKIVATGATGATQALTSVSNLSTGMMMYVNGVLNPSIFITSITYAPSPAIVLSESITTATDDQLTFEDVQYPIFPDPYSNSNIVLTGDNINKVPRDLNKVGPTDRVYSSKVNLYNRVNPLMENTSPLTFYNTQHLFGTPVLGDEALSIRPFRDLGDWTSQSSPYYPVKLGSNGIPVANADKLQLFYKAEENPFVASLRTNSLIGINPVNTVSETYTKRTLAVFETEPTTSLLDIFFETSTSDLISNLNTAVDSTDQGPASFSARNYSHNEAPPPPTVPPTDPSQLDITSYFELLKADGNPCADNSVINMSNLRVVDGDGQIRSNDFTLVANVANPNVEFKIRTNALFYYGSTASSTESYTFTLDCVANGIQNTLSFTGQLSNTKPSFTTPVAGIEVIQLSSLTSQTEIFNKIARNGSADPNRYNNEVFARVMDITPPTEQISNKFYIDNVSGTGNSLQPYNFVLHPYVNNLFAGNTYTIRVDLFDAVTSLPLTTSPNNTTSYTIIMEIV
tara:strand:- start:14244 stop:17783 length:3540 start_codon:yes stop_codon:yes gene_type:complete